jgi:DNA-binding transcriptional LysR family regulator
MRTDPMKRHVRLRDLDTLLAVVQAGGMRKAALQLHLSQPAVSKAVRSLEDALGVSLLERGKRGVEPTKFGLALTQRSKAAFDELRQAVSDIEHLGDPQGGELRLGSMETLNAGVVGTALERMSARYSRMRFHLQPGNSRHLLDHFLHERAIEFAVVRPPTLPLSSALRGESLFVDQFLIVVSAEHRHAKRRRITLAELVDEHWIASEAEADALSPLARAFQAAGASMPTPRLRTDSISLRFRLLATGRWVTLMPRSVLHFMPPSRLLRALPIELPTWDVPNMIVTNRDRTLSPLADRFLDTLREVARSINW